MQCRGRIRDINYPCYECEVWSADKWADFAKVLKGNRDRLEAKRRKMALMDDPSRDPLAIPGLSGRLSSFPPDRNLASIVFDPRGASAIPGFSVMLSALTSSLKPCFDAFIKRFEDFEHKLKARSISRSKTPSSSDHERENHRRKNRSPSPSCPRKHQNDERSSSRKL